MFIYYLQIELQVPKIISVLESNYYAFQQVASSTAH